MNFAMTFQSPSMPDPYQVLKGYKESSEIMATMMMEKGRSFIDTAVAFNKFVHAEMHPGEEIDQPSAPLLELSLDLLFGIFEYLPPRDLAIMVSEVIPALEYAEEQFVKLQWEVHLRKRWELSTLPPLSGTEMRKLFPCCRQIIPPALAVANDTISQGSAAEFTGPIGVSNRAVRSLRGFPSLFPGNASKASMMTSCSMMLRELSNAVGGKKKPTLQAALSDKSLHSTPFVYLNSQMQTQMFYHLRAVAYYEVSILPVVLGHPTAPAANPPAAGAAPGEPPNDCIAVGLSTLAFPISCRLPGWDKESFGYHSDDGAIFHGQGKHLSTYGPRFGVNDVVGCGINYLDHSIFFTLNGNYLGTAFTDVSLFDELFPTVGLDANVRVDFNFGVSRPFWFDLRAFLLNNELCLR